MHKSRKKKINEQILTFFLTKIVSLGYACCLFARAVGWAEAQWGGHPQRRESFKSPWVQIFVFHDGNSALHNVQGFRRNDGSWFGITLPPHLTGFLLGRELWRCLFCIAPHWPTQKNTQATVWVGMQKQCVWRGRRDRKDLGCVQISSWCPPWLPWGDMNINADPPPTGSLTAAGGQRC